MSRSARAPRCAHNPHREGMGSDANVYNCRRIIKENGQEKAAAKNKKHKGPNRSDVSVSADVSAGRAEDTAIG